MRRFLSGGKAAIPVILCLLAGIPAATLAGEPGAPEMGSASLKALGALGLVLALILLLAWLARRYLRFLPQGSGRGDSIQIVSARSLGPKRSVYLLEVEGRRLLVGSAEAGVSLLKDFAGSDSHIVTKVRDGAKTS